MAERSHQRANGGSIPAPSLQSSKAHQRLIRETHEQQPEFFIEEKRELATSLKNAWVREIDYQAASEVILKYEWLGNMDTTRQCFGLFFGDYLAG